MSTSPKNKKNKDKNKKNQDKHKRTHKKDISNNDAFFNLGRINIKNPLLSSLLESKKKNNNIIENISPLNKIQTNETVKNQNKSSTRFPNIYFNIDENNNKNIKTNITNRNMRLSNIDQNIAGGQKNNKDTITHLKNIGKTLEETNNELKKIIVTPDNNPVTKKIIDALVNEINDNYEKINNLHGVQNKTKKTCPPPGFLPKHYTTSSPVSSPLLNLPPLPPHHRRTDIMYIPPHSQNIFTDASKIPIPMPLPPPLVKKEYKEINVEINGLKDILKLIEDNPLSPAIEYNINMESIHKIKVPLIELDRMIGMNKLKDSIVDQVIYFVQNLHINNDAVNPDFMHTCIYGPPGTGKTEVAKIMGKIFSSMGVLKKNYFRKVTRADLIAGYLGQTAIKTRDVVKEALGGVLFIDEAYALGNSEKRDSFAKECIDTLCECLSDNKEQLMVIIAGYEEDLKKCFFAYNQGLNSRFPWRFKTDDYNAEELNQIFQKKIQDAGWSLKEDIPNGWFESKKEHFKFFGRDMETLLSKSKIAHGRRVFCKPKSEKKKLTLQDLEKGYKMFIENNGKKDVDLKKTIIDHMYL